MTARRPRAELLPNANNPRLLMRLLHQVSCGIRRPRGLAEILEVEVRTVHYYTQAAEWLGLLETDEIMSLTPLGLSLAFADEADRMKVYADAVWENRFVQALWQEYRSLPETEALNRFILKWEPQLSEATAERRASAIRGLLEPAVARPPAQTAPQLDLPLGLVSPPPPAPQKPPPVDLSDGVDHNLDVYARLLQALLANGELGTHHIRALLDEMGGRRCPLGGYIEMVMRRGDAHRVDERLIVSPGAIRRRQLSTDGQLIALSDPLYREWIDHLRDGDAPPALARRFASWDRRLFGAPLTVETVQDALSDTLIDRGLDSFETARPALAPFHPPQKPFLEAIDDAGLVLTFPGALRDMAEGVTAINERLLSARRAPLGVRLPSIVDDRIATHGGLLHPGERPPRAFADNRSLRLRALSHSPAFSLLGALLLLDRRRTAPLVVTARGGVRHGERTLGGLVAVMMTFCAAQGWTVSASPGDGLDDEALMRAAIGGGLVQRIGDRSVLAEPLFALLQEDPEARLCYEPLLPLEERWLSWLETLSSS
ncbi:MAG: hypothetical protein AAFV53_13840 [Myxococcota bacterium]